MQTETTNQPTPELATEHKKPTLSLPAAIITAAAIIAVALIVVFGPNTGGTKQAGTAGTPPAPKSISKEVLSIKNNDRIRGSLDTAQVVVIEYSDSDCPFCSRFHTTMQQVVTDYNGSVAWVYRHFPLASLHPNATAEAVAAECVGSLGGNDTFNAYLDKIIGVTLDPGSASTQALTSYAKAVGVDEKLFAACIAGTAASDRVAADAAEAQSIGAQGTPFSIIVNLKTGKYETVPGAYPIADVKAKIDALLK
jgi:protein-disulfide isomerase